MGIPCRLRDTASWPWASNAWSDPREGTKLAEGFWFGLTPLLLLAHPTPAHPQKPRALQLRPPCRRQLQPGCRSSPGHATMTHSPSLASPHPPPLQEAPHFPASRLEWSREGPPDPQQTQSAMATCTSRGPGREQEPPAAGLQPSSPHSSQQGPVPSGIRSSPWHLLSTCVMRDAEHAVGAPHSPGHGGRFPEEGHWSGPRQERVHVCA